MNGHSDRERAAAVARLLDREGISCEGVMVAGAENDVAVVRTASVDADRLAAVAKQIRTLGFRYVTIDLQSVGQE